MRAAMALLSQRVKRIRNAVGWAYVGYHILAAVFFVPSAVHDVNPGYLRTAEFQREMLFVVLFYPILIPALLVCGGLHDRCESVLGRATQWVVLGSTIVWWIAGWGAVGSMVVRRLRQYSFGRREHQTD
jgi:hypothetical protein